ncbi:MAG: DNA primase [Planctomycetota bacterium]
MTFQGNDDKERVQGATDLVRLVGEHVQLRPKGREVVGLCPFHDDKTPSMYVSSSKQIYKCFSCGAGGDCFSFVMDYHKMDFREALKYLADRAGIELTPFKAGRDGAQGGGGGAGGASPRKRLLAANEQALEFFVQQLHSPTGRTAQQYIEQRRISDEMVEAFQLGYAPDAWSALADAAAARGLDLVDMDQAGLILQRNGGAYRDKFLHRLIFPICDDLGRPIAFGGRELPGQQVTKPKDPGYTNAKYLNTAETPLFNKSATLYGLHLAKKPIIDAKTAVIVEGYTDVIACHQHGAKNVVAALGTAFTTQHASKLRRFCDKVVLIFDGDTAGQKAADRAVEVLLTGEIDVAIAILPGGQDPDELLATEGGLQRWNGLVGAAEDALSYLLNRMRQALADAGGTITGKQNVATQFLSRLARHGVGHLPAIRRALILDQLANLLHLSPSQVMDELRRLEPRDRPASPPPPPSEPPGQPENQTWVRESGPEQDSEANPGVRYEAEGAESVAPSVSGAKLRGITLAERRLIGCLLRRNDLFEHTLRDGTDFCEALPPGELTPEHRRIYQLIHDRLCDAAEQTQPLTLSGLLAELAERGWDAERRLVTLADVELDQALGGKPERIENVFLSEAEVLQSFAREREYERQRQRLPDGLDPTLKENAVQQALRKARQATPLIEHLAQQSSTGRISRQRGRDRSS